MIDDERPDAPDEQPADQDVPGGSEESLEPSASADPSEAPTAGDDAAEETPADAADGDDTEIIASDGASIADAAGDDDTEIIASDGASIADAAADDDTEIIASDGASIADAAGDDDTEIIASDGASIADAAADDDTEIIASDGASVVGDSEGSAGASIADEADAPAEGQPPAEERPRREKRKRDDEAKEPEGVPGAHLEPDLVLEPERPAGDEDDLARYVSADDDEAAEQPAAEEGAEPADAPAEQPAARSIVDLAADARYQATGKRKTAVARVIISPGDGGYTINGRSLEDFFPRAALQKAARQPLEVAGFERRMNVTARIHGGGVAAQAGALRHGVARALVEADPSLRPELKRRGLLTRDARAKERKKAGLKKARKRPQFSKR